MLQHVGHLYQLSDDARSDKYQISYMLQSQLNFIQQAYKSTIPFLLCGMPQVHNYCIDNISKDICGQSVAD